MRIRYYIDESGNTGDLTKYDPVLGFGDQPYFSLAAIGIPDTALLERSVAELRQKHRVNIRELKASVLWDKPEFTLDIVRLIGALSLPYFIELVDKRFFLCINIISFQLLRPFDGGPEGVMVNFVRNELAEHLYRQAPNEVLDAFVTACKDPGDATLRKEFTALQSLAKFADDEDGRGEGLQESIVLALEEYEEELLSTPNAYYAFLPFPDDSKRGRPIWLLPNVSSLTNIYARINLLEGGNLSEIAMVHDEQAHFDELLQHNKTVAESLRNRRGKMYTPHSDFDFLQSAPLVFARSTDSLGIQIADLLAGFCMRYARDLLLDSKAITPAAHECFHRLISGARPTRGTGVNLVMTSQHASLLLTRGSPITSR